MPEELLGGQGGNAPGPGAAGNVGTTAAAAPAAPAAPASPPAAPAAPATPATPAVQDISPDHPNYMPTQAQLDAQALAAGRAAPVVDPAAAATPAAAAAVQATLRDSIRQQYGFDLNVQNDDEVLPYLLQQARYAQQLDQQNRAAQAQAYQQFLATQGQPPAAAAPAAPAQPAKPKLWDPPEWRPEWDRMIGRDAGGQMTGPPEIVAKKLAHDAYRQEFAQRLTTDPTGTMAPFIAERAREEAKTMIDEMREQMRDEIYAGEFIRTNTSWLHAHDAQGRTLTTMDPVLRKPVPVLSAEGTRFRQYIEMAHNAGVRDLQTQEQMAMRMLRADIYESQQQQPAAPAAPANPAAPAAPAAPNANQQFLLAHNRRPANTGATLLPAQPGTNPPAAPAQPGQTFGQLLREAFAQGGVTDADFRDRE